MRGSLCLMLVAGLCVSQFPDKQTNKQTGADEDALYWMRLLLQCAETQIRMDIKANNPTFVLHQNKEPQPHVFTVDPSAGVSVRERTGSL